MLCNICRSQLRFCPFMYNSITTRALVALRSKRKPSFDPRRLIHTRNLPSHKGSKINSKPSQSTSIAQSNAVPYLSLETRLAKRGMPTLLYQAPSYRPVHISQSVLFMIDWHIDYTISFESKKYSYPILDSQYSLHKCTVLFC